MNKNITKMLIAALLAAIIAFSSGCSKQRDYGEEYNYETDCQYSYYCGVSFWKIVQSDGDGQYIFRNSYIYYYNTKEKTMTPLCNKPNCLHDMETDKDRLCDCNAYTPINGINYFIQYYDGYIYCFSASDGEDLGCESLYRLKKDGSKKDKIFTTDDEMPVVTWLIHRGYLYYATQTHSYGEDGTYTKCMLKSLELSSNMSEKNAKVIFESDEEHDVLSLSYLKAYKNYLCYFLTANEKDSETTDNESGFKQLYLPMYIYNIETGENNEIPVPKGCSDTTYIGRVMFLEDKILLSLGDNVANTQNRMDNLKYKLPIYSINYDLTDEKIWLDGVEQGKWVQTYDDYVIISDAFIQFYPYIYPDVVSDSDLLPDKSELCTNVEIYSSDGKRISYFVYPINEQGSFSGFGPDGINVAVESNDESWSVYELNFKDVLNCHGEKVKLDRVNTRKFGPLHGVD